MNPSALTFPIYFLSYDEPNAEENWQELQKRYPRSKRLHGISGIQRAHQMCALDCDSTHFFVVDGDNKVDPGFRFSISSQQFDPKAIHVWRCKNPVNDLVYGYGAIKLFPVSPFKKIEMGLDLSTGLGVPYKILPEVASETHFHHTPFQAWRGAFRESAKLTKQIAMNPNDSQSLHRLDAWCKNGGQRPNGRWVIEGAKSGKAFALSNLSDSKNLEKINNFDWLEGLFIEKFHQDGRVSEIYPS